MKRLHIYMLKQFIPLLLMTASICWFVVVMQFLWRYTDDFVGKGLALSTLMEAFVQVALCITSPHDASPNRNYCSHKRGALFLP